MTKKHSHIARAFSTSEDFSDYGKTLPQATDIEEVILGAILLESNIIYEIADKLKEEHFCEDTNREIFKAIHTLFKEAKNIDELTVTHKLRENGKLEFIGGAYYIAQLSQKVNSTAHVNDHMLILKEKYMRRKMIETSNKAKNKAYDDTEDIFELLGEAEKDLYSIVTETIITQEKTSKKVLLKSIDSYQARKEMKMAGIPSGYEKIDRLIGGWQAPDLIIIAARPGMGKSILMLMFARNAIKYDFPVAIFSLEMSDVQLMNRLVSAEVEIASNKINKGYLEDNDIQFIVDQTNELANEFLIIDDSPSLSIVELKSKTKRMITRYGIKMVLIDYLQLMDGITGFRENIRNREQEISNISKNLKALAKELNIPVIALSQLSRAVETRSGNKIPQLSDLRESGSLEQDADIVMFLYRPAYYSQKADSAGNEYPVGYTLLNVDKHRNGATDSIPLTFIGKFSKFKPMDEQSSIPFKKTEEEIRSPLADENEDDENNVPF